MADLLSTISGYLTPEMIQKAASLIGESPAATQKSASIAVPTILSGLASLASSDTGASQLVNMISRVAGDGNILNELGALFGGGPSAQTTMNAGRDALQTIFGGKLNGVIEALASASGVKQTPASSLLSLVVPLVLGVLGRERKTAGLDAGGLASLLRNQRGSWASLLPGAVSTLLGAAGPAATVRPAAPPPPPPAPGQLADAVDHPAGAARPARRMAGIARVRRNGAPGCHHRAAARVARHPAGRRLARAQGGGLP
jgi:OmpA-OmpF porin, OOP family